MSYCPPVDCTRLGYVVHLRDCNRLRLYCPPGRCSTTWGQCQVRFSVRLGTIPGSVMVYTSVPGSIIVSTWGLYQVRFSVHLGTVPGSIIGSAWGLYQVPFWRPHGYCTRFSKSEHRELCQVVTVRCMARPHSTRLYACPP